MSGEELIRQEAENLNAQMGALRKQLESEGRAPTDSERVWLTRAVIRMGELAAQNDGIKFGNFEAFEDNEYTARSANPELLNSLKPGPWQGGQGETREERGQRHYEFGRFLQDVLVASKPGGKVSDRLRKAQERASGLQTIVGSEGGFLLDSQFSSYVFQRVYDSPIIQRCWTENLSEGKGSFILPYVDETSRATGSRLGGIQGYWLEEGGTITDSKPKFGQSEIRPKKQAVLCYATSELANDAQNLGAVIEKGMVEELRFMLEDSIINGNGVGKPLGFLSSACCVECSATRSAGNLTYTDLVTMYSRLWARSKANAVWLANQDIEPKLYTLTHPGDSTSGVIAPAFIPAGKVANTPYGKLLGRDIIFVEQAQSLGTKGDISLVDLSQYLLVTAGDIRLDQSIHVKFSEDEIAFRAIWRSNGQPVWNAALTPFKGSATQSPFVCVASGS